MKHTREKHVACGATVEGVLFTPHVARVEIAMLRERNQLVFFFKKLKSTMNSRRVPVLPPFPPI